jgi:prolyl oligopeptidase PreP (S9A serine peptidase family)
MTEYGWKWHGNGIKINKKNLVTDNTLSSKQKRT